MDAGQSGRAVVFELLVGGEAGDNDAYQVVGIAEETLGLDGVGDLSSVERVRLPYRQ